MLVRKGDIGQEVKQIQRELDIEADGVFGPITESAVMRFQVEEHLDVDGIVGPKTWAALFGLTTDIQESLDSQHGIVINHHILPKREYFKGPTKRNGCSYTTQQDGIIHIALLTIGVEIVGAELQPSLSWVGRLYLTTSSSTTVRLLSVYLMGVCLASRKKRIPRDAYK